MSSSSLRPLQSTFPEQVDYNLPFFDWKDEIKEIQSNKSRIYFNKVYFKHKEWHQDFNVSDNVLVLMQDDNSSQTHFCIAEIAALFKEQDNVDPMATVNWYDCAIDKVVKNNELFYRTNKEQYKEIPKNKLLFLNKTRSKRQDIFVECIQERVIVINTINKWVNKEEYYYCDRIEYEDDNIPVKLYSFNTYKILFNNKNDNNDDEEWTDPNEPPQKKRKYNNGISERIKHKHIMKQLRKNNKDGINDVIVIESDEDSDDDIQILSVYKPNTNSIIRTNNNNKRLNRHKNDNTNRNKIQRNRNINNTNVNNNRNGNTLRVNANINNNIIKRKRKSQWNTNNNNIFNNKSNRNMNSRNIIPKSSRTKPKNNRNRKQSKPKQRQSLINIRKFRKLDAKQRKLLNLVSQTQQEMENRMRLPHLTNTQLKKIYKHNKVQESDHTPSAVIILCKVQEIVENKLEPERGERARFIDPCGLRCGRDNFLSSTWNNDGPAYINCPFSGQNPKRWLGQSILHWQNGQSVIFLAKTAGFGNDYWFEPECENKASSILFLRKTFAFPGYTKKTPFSVALIVFDKHNRNINKNGVKTEWVDLDEWALKLGKDKLIGLIQRMKKRITMSGLS